MDLMFVLTKWRISRLMPLILANKNAIGMITALAPLKFVIFDR
jgi:hypothetical protein